MRAGDVAVMATEGAAGGACMADYASLIRPTWLYLLACFGGDDKPGGTRELSHGDT